MTKTYTEEFKQDAVRLVGTSGKPKTQVARDLGISESALYRWIKVYEVDHPQTTTSNGQSVQALEAELKRLRRENEVLRQERDILKKLSASTARIDGELPDDQRLSEAVCR